MTSSDDRAGRDETIRTFKESVNMSSAALRRWLDMPESKSVGMTHEGERVAHEGGAESVGHEMGRRILELKAKPVSALDEDDLMAMSKVTGYVHRHLAQRPAGDVSATRWRSSLMNWGHDPLHD